MLLHPPKVFENYLRIIFLCFDENFEKVFFPQKFVNVFIKFWNFCSIIELKQQRYFSCHLYQKVSLIVL